MTNPLNDRRESSMRISPHMYDYIGRNESIEETRTTKKRERRMKNERYHTE